MSNWVGSSGSLVITLVSPGQTFARTSSLISGVAHPFSPQFLDLGGGAYQVTQFFTRSGLWEWIGEASDGTPLVLQWNVENRASIGITRKQLRRDIMKDLGDLTILTATVDGRDVTFADYVYLYGPENAYKGRQIRFTSGTQANIGLERVLTGSEYATRSIGWGDPLPAPVVAGDECEMVNTRNMMFKFQDVHEAINVVIRSIKKQALTMGALSSVNYAYGAAIAAPDDFETIEDVQYQDLADPTVWRRIPKAKNPGSNGWWVDKSTRTVQIGRHHACHVQNHVVRIRGLQQPPELYEDEDVTEIDSEWLVMAVQARMIRGRFIRQATPEIERLMFQINQEAVRIGPKAKRQRGPWSASLS